MGKTVNEAFMNAIEAYRNKEFLVASSDMLVQYIEENKLIRFYDDSEELIIEAQLEKSDKWTDHAKAFLRTNEFSDVLKTIDVLRPFSVILVDEDFVPIEELVTVCDDNIYLDDQFLKEYNNDLDTFFNKLMEE